MCDFILFLNLAFACKNGETTNCLDFRIFLCAVMRQHLKQ